MFTLALKFDASINAERFTSAASPVMRLSSDQSIVEYRSHLESLKNAVDGLDDCFAQDGEQDAEFRAEQRRELKAMQSMTPEQWRSMECARKYREQWNRYHAAKLNPALRYTFPVCMQISSWPAVR